MIKSLKKVDLCNKAIQFFFFLLLESGIVFRSVKEVERYLQTGEVPKQAKKPQWSVTDFYSFESNEEMVMN